MLERLRRFGIYLTRSESGQTNVEYALILLLVALATIALLIALAAQTSGVLLNSVAQSLNR